MSLVDGNDVSSYQPNWTPKKGQEFCFVKCSEGTTYLNPYKDEQVSKARKAGLVVGHYHWLHHGNLDAQVAYFASNAGVRESELILVDWEEPDVTCAEKDSFIKKLKARFPKNRVGLYCNTTYWTQRDTTSYVGDYLHIAYYSDNTSVKPPIQYPWLFWQYSQTPIDKNISTFTSKQQLKDWASNTKSAAVVIDRRAKVAFRGGWTCGCVATSLPLVEADMIKKGLIKESIDIWQLGYRDDVGASAGTHAKGGNTDVDQYSPAQIQCWWDWGWNIQKRTIAQGFAMYHGHGAPVGCPHMSSSGQDQMDDWKNGRDGLIQNLKVPGWPGWIHWETALAKKAGAVADKAAEKAAKNDKEEDVARDRIAKSRSKDQKNVSVGNWQPVWVVNDQERTVATGPCGADFSVKLRVQNVTEGEAVYVRAVTYDIVNGKPVRNKGSETQPQELDGQKGDMWGQGLPFSCVVGGPSKKKGHTSRRLLIEWMCNDPKAVIADVEITGWSVKK